MKKIRIGKDIAVRWEIKTNGEVVSLEGRDLKLEMRNSFSGVREISFSRDGNFVLFTFFGKEQKELGKYRLTLWENYGEEGQSVVDACDAFELVQCTCKEDLEGGEYDLHIENLNLTGDIATASVNLSIQKPYTYIEWVAEYLYKIGYDMIDYDFAKNYFLKNNPDVKPAGCSSVRNGNFYGRNYDWFYNKEATFIVKTAHAQKRYAVLGVAGSIAELTDDFVDSRAYSEKYKILPFCLQDGINEKGVFCNVNVVPMDKGKTTLTIPNIEERERLCTIMLPRFVLDRFATAREAVEYIRDYVALYVPQTLQAMDYEVHFMIGDETKTYVVEIVENRVKVKEHAIMTNFFLDGVTFDAGGMVYTNADVADGHLPSVENGITANGSGLERYNLIVEFFLDANTKDGMRSMMDILLYTNAYKDTTAPFWYSEFVSKEKGFSVDTLPTDADFQAYITLCKGYYEGRDREDPKTWHTNHSCVYDIAERKMYLVSQEETLKEFEFS